MRHCFEPEIAFKLLAEGYRPVWAEVKIDELWFSAWELWFEKHEGSVRHSTRKARASWVYGTKALCLDDWQILNDAN